MTPLSDTIAGAPLMRGRSIPGLARVLALLSTVMDVFAETQAMARAAHKRYPFFAEG